MIINYLHLNVKFKIFQRCLAAIIMVVRPENAEKNLQISAGSEIQCWQNRNLHELTGNTVRRNECARYLYSAVCWLFFLLPI